MQSVSSTGVERIERAKRLLGEEVVNGDVQITAEVLGLTSAGSPIGVVSNDRRVRTVAEGLGATATGTVVVIVRAVESGTSEADAKRLVRRVESHGQHTTGELRDRTYDLIEEAAERRSSR